MKDRLINLLLLAFVLVAIEGGSFAIMRGYYALFGADSPAALEYVTRGHPLFVDNSDLRETLLNIDYAPVVGYRLTPGTVHTRDYPTYTSRLEVDAAGFIHNGDAARNETMLAEGPESLVRIVFFGGSTTAGRGASDNAHTIPAQFERALQTTWPGVPFHVINAGTWGYQSFQEDLLYLTRIRALRPDMVVFLDGDNDAEVPLVLADWRPYHSPLAEKVINNHVYKGLFQPAFTLQLFARSLLSFPQPMYSLALLSRVVDRVTPPPPAEILDAGFHPEAARQLRDSLTAAADRAQADGTAALFFLQPILALDKPQKSERERELEAQTAGHIRNYAPMIAKYFASFESVYAGLDREFRGDGLIQFHDITGLFATTSAHIYESRWHYNDGGNGMIAARMAHVARPIVTQIVHRKGLGAPVAN